MKTQPTTQYPPKVTAALELIREECLREEWLDLTDLPDIDAACEYVTDTVYLPEPSGLGKPGAGEFTDYGDASAHAYLIVLGWERIGSDLAHDPGNEHAGELDQDQAEEAGPLVQTRTGHRSCPLTGMPHRLGGSVLAPICLDCEVLN